MVYQAYVDESGDGKNVVIAGAVVGKKEDWEQFARRWKERLDEDGIEYFKSSHCESLNGQFHKFRELGMEKAEAEGCQAAQ